MTDELLKQLIAAQLANSVYVAKILNEKKDNPLSSEELAKHVFALWQQMKVLVDQICPKED